MTKTIEEIYSNYPQEVREYMSNLVNCLKKDYGSIPTSWRISLDLIADNYSIYLKAKQDVDKEGFITEDRAKRERRNQNLNIMNAAQDRIIKLISAFALTPMTKGKLKKPDNVVNDELEELIA